MEKHEVLVSDILLRSISLNDFRTVLGEVVEQKLKLFKPEPPQQTNGEYITRRDVCKLLKISLATLFNYTKDGTLKGYRIGGRVLYKLVEVQNSIQVIQSVKYKHVRG